MQKEALFFGCESSYDIGHCLVSNTGKPISFCPQTDHPGFPWKIHHLDGGLLENGEVKDRPTGKVYWTQGGRHHLWYAFYWWDRKGDSRPGSNSGLYVRGFDFREQEEAFKYGCAQWPKIVARQKHPLELVTREP